MRGRSTFLAGALAVAACTGPSGPVGASRAALGEPMDGFPSWEERVVHVWTNRARQDPAADLASCSVCAEAACYSPVPPLVWDHQLARAARFHSDNLALAGCSLQHDSPCTLVSNLGTIYTPGSCDGAPSCACVGGSATCGSSGTGFGARVRLFGPSPSAENIATGSDPVSTFYRWLHEPDSNPMCGWRISNGHRANILGGSGRLGVGKTAAGRIWTQDFGGGGSPDGIVSGVHYPATGASIEFRANWYRSGAGPAMAMVNVDGTCTPMTLERGSAGNGTYLATVGSISGCTRYYFQFDDGTSDITYPTTGSFGIGCPDDWSATRPSLCGCTPSCGGAMCGPDGCGGSCGTCGAGRTCSSGTCVCSGGTTDCGGTCVDTDTDNANCGSCGNPCGAMQTCMGGSCVSTCTPSCAGRACGDDGCGGSCGTCPASRTCDPSGQCVCAAGRMDCSGACIDTQTDPSHCGACGNACAPAETCAMGSCQCVPDCSGRSCGDDGCGSSCGSCAADRLCNAGTCDCAGALTDCGGTCTDVRIDEANCGTCGNPCGAMEVCLAGACTMTGPDAGAACVPACDGRECGDDTCGGDCGACGPGRVCGTGGLCLCDAAATDCGGTCTDLRTDAANCGACGTACASDQRCVASECVGGEPMVDGGPTPDGGASGADAGPSGASDTRLVGTLGCAARPGRSGGGLALGILLALLLRRRRRS